MIAPTFETLSTKYSKPNKIAFCKINTDNQGEVAQQYGVRAMPTFLVLRNGTVTETIQGANPNALITAVEKAVKLAGPGGGNTFATPGQRLGGSGVGPGAARRMTVGRPGAGFDLKGFVEAVIAFVGLYFWSLFSVGLVDLRCARCVRRGANVSQLDPYKAAENSPFNKYKNPPPAAQSGSGARPAARPGFRTLADLTSE
jgi:hypothetical protein